MAGAERGRRRAAAALLAVGSGTALGGLGAAQQGSRGGLVLAMAVVGLANGALLLRRRRRPGAGVLDVVGGLSARAWLAAAALALGSCTVTGVLLTGRPVGVGVLLTAGLASAGVLGRWRPRRRDERALRADHPGAPVVRAVLVDDASLHLALWARGAGVALPVQLGFDLLLVATADGLGLWASSTRRRRPGHLALVPWDDASVHAESAPASGAASWGGARVVLTLRGPAASRHARRVPRERRAHRVAMLVYEGSSPVTGTDAVEAVVAHLTGAVRASQ